MKKILIIISISIIAMACHANEATNQHVWIVNGGSLVNIDNPLPFTTNGGKYLTLEGALHQKGFDYVSNSAVGGGAATDSTVCFPDPLGGDPLCFEIDGYQKQFDKGLSKVINPATGLITADYGLIAIGNQCMSSLPHGPLSAYPLTAPCETADLNFMIDIEVSVGNQLCALGIDVIYDDYPAYEDMDLTAFLNFGATWIIDNEADWNEMADLRKTRVLNEVSCAIVIPVWDIFNTIDGVHADGDSQRKGAKKIKTGIQDHLDS